MPELSLSSLSDTFSAELPIMLLMAAASVVVVAVALARLWTMIHARIQLRRLDTQVLESVRAGNWEEARKRCESIGSPFREIFVAGLDRVLGKVKGNPAMAMAREQKRTMGKVRATLWVLGSTGALMPFVGLFGTVVGVMSAFSALGHQDDAGSMVSSGVSVVSGGIGQALIATAAGLFVALEAIICFNILQNMSTNVGRDLGLLVDELLELASVRRADAERSG
ncbi:MAG TPA: MotA/TolQ/ExbB proton channel family protein [Myxococcota bacterium]|nr:MotA/TolQ/ExbB proton channel family protein [Myxococcota bacterium]